FLLCILVLRKVLDVLQTLYNSKTTLELVIYSLSNVNCWNNRRVTQGAIYVLPHTIYSFPVKEKGSNRIVWKCELKDAKNKKYLIIWRAYRGAALPRCGQIHEYIAELKGVSLVRNNKPL
ncbi:hypothetical protein HID58_004839, partial [Brassica napus]